MCGQVWWPILRICALHLTHPSVHTPGAVDSQCCGTRGAVGGSVPCSRVSPQSWYWRWRERSLFTPPTDNSCRTWDSNPQPRVASPSISPHNGLYFGQNRKLNSLMGVVSYKLNLSLKMLTDRLKLIDCGLSWCFYQLFELSFWRHPFTLHMIHWWASDVMLNFSKSVSNKESNSSTFWMAWGWVNWVYFQFWLNFSFQGVINMQLKMY